MNVTILTDNPNSWIIPYIEDLKKDSIEIPHPKGNISIKLPNHFDSSKPLRVKSKGFNNGDMYINQFIVFDRS